MPPQQSGELFLFSEQINRPKFIFLVQYTCLCLILR